MRFSGAELAQRMGAVCQADGPPGPLATDSRRLRSGDWFLALVGDRFDGHDYLRHAAAAGCAGVVAERVPEGWTHGWVQTPDTLRALQDLAHSVRAEFGGPVVGITGSAGKTTTRALTALALGTRGPVHATEGNLNNHIGVPLTILNADIDAWAWVVEMGMSNRGEIHRLQEIGEPTVRLITNVGPAHLDTLGTLDAIGEAKGELFDGARPGDTCIVNADDDRIASRSLPEGVRTVRYGMQTGVDVRLTDASVDSRSLTTRYRIEVGDGVVRGEIPAPGLHLAQNACAAVAVARSLHLPLDGIADAFSGYVPVGMRLRPEEGPRGLRILNDAYNANPISTQAALRTLAAIPDARRVALLGDMLELGPLSESAHREVVELALSLDLDLVGLAGPRFTEAAKGRDVVAAPDAVSLARAVGPELREGDVVLLKGSRGLAMEQVLLHLDPPEDAS